MFPCVYNFLFPCATIAFFWMTCPMTLYIYNEKKAIHLLHVNNREIETTTCILFICFSVCKYTHATCVDLINLRYFADICRRALKIGNIKLWDAADVWCPTIVFFFCSVKNTLRCIWRRTPPIREILYKAVACSPHTSVHWTRRDALHKCCGSICTENQTNPHVRVCRTD